jgi:hypothetical protein
MSAGDVLGIFLLILLIGFGLAFIYLVFLQRRAVVTQSKASTHVTTITSQQEAALSLQKESEQRQLLALEIAKQQLALQKEYNERTENHLARIAISLEQIAAELKNLTDKQSEHSLERK